jgi:redox-sensitive bicupin YhaK (pirin superfamily)
MIHRKIVNSYTPPAQQGFLGQGHIARPVIQIDYQQSDPFIMLMDDRLDKQDNEPAGGPHPHAGFETVTLVLSGEFGDETHQMKAGDFQMMTAGSGVIHTETIREQTKMQLLQLWLTLPKKDRWAPPRQQDVLSEQVPELKGAGYKVRLYSGSLEGLVSPVLNYVPLIVAEIILEPRASANITIPASFNTLLYVIEGQAKVGDGETTLDMDQAGWLDRYPDNDASVLRLSSGEEATRLVLYSAPQQGDGIVSHGPFIGDTQEDILRLYREYRQGKMKHISTLPESQRINWNGQR